MLIEFQDFNHSNIIIQQKFASEWDSIVNTLNAMPLHLKASYQKGIQGSPIFDPVGTNEFIKTDLVKKGWQVNIPIPQDYQFLGTDIDCGRAGIIVEFQFSNYPFLLNNMLRSELFFKSKIPLFSHATELVLIITKARMFPASNSTLYYEQAVNQLSALAKYNVFDVPIRLVGLFEDFKPNIPIIWTEYKQQRSRTIIRQQNKMCSISRGNSPRSRAILKII